MGGNEKSSGDSISVRRARTRLSRAISFSVMLQAVAEQTDVGTRIRAALAREDAPACPTATLPLQQSKAGGSGAFLVAADDGRRYWCKCVENPQSPRVPINEQLVGRLGQLIEVATCEVTLIRLPPELADWEFRRGRKLVPGYAHASVAVPTAIETRSIRHPQDDDNPSRLTGLGVLADWCWAGDHQWLYEPTEENRYFSHDHGHYFPSGPNWTTASLAANDALAKAPGAGHFPMTRTDVVHRIIDRMEQIKAEAIASAFAGLPKSWQVTDDELVAMVEYLDRRRAAVIARLQNAHPKQKEATP